MSPRRYDGPMRSPRGFTKGPSSVGPSMGSPRRGGYQMRSPQHGPRQGEHRGLDFRSPRNGPMGSPRGPRGPDFRNNLPQQPDHRLPRREIALGQGYAKNIKVALPGDPTKANPRRELKKSLD